MADQGGGHSVIRDYRKGNWTMSETMILIEAKKMDDERRMKMRSSGGGETAAEGLLIRASSSSSSSSAKPSEPRWKWVEDYCWRKGCYRSQNQCNDKWDNLMRDYKKVRDYERRVMQMGSDNGNTSSLLSYWKMERIERKEKNLPTNMMPQIYDALVEVVEKKSHQPAAVASASGVSGGGGGGAVVSVSAPPLSQPHVGYLMERPTVAQQPSVSLPPHVPSPLIMPQNVNVTPPVPHLLPPPPPPVAAQPQPPRSHTTPCEESESSEHSDSSAKRRRRGRRGGGGEGEGEEGVSGSIHYPPSNEVGNAISRSASIIAQALQACDEREEKRHRETLSLHERRLKLEESKTEINRQGINGLVDAINKLANSIHALASSSKNNLPPTG